MGCIQSRDKPDPYNGKSTPCETADDGAPHSSVSPAMAATPTAPAATIAAASSNGRSGLEGVPLGVNVDFLKSFLLQIQPVIAEAELDMITTKDVCDLFIIPETRDRGCAYIDLVRERDELCEHVKPANVFVSHAWKYSFEQLIRTAIRYGEEEEAAGKQAYFWIDVFMNNQNIADVLPQDWWSTTFRSSISKIGTVLLVMTPWHDPIPMQRAWCLWEMMCALDQSTEMHIRLPEQEFHSFRDAFIESFHSVTNMLVRVQAERAESHSPADRDMIFQQIAKSIGFDELNAAIKDRLRAWCLDCAEAFIAEMEQKGEDQTAPETYGLLCYNVAAMYESFRGPDDVIQVLEKATAGFSRSGTVDKHPGVFIALANAFSLKGDVDASIENTKQALQIYLDTIGENDSLTAGPYHGLGNGYADKGDFDTALQMYEKALNIYLGTVGRSHHYTANTLNAIGRVQADLKRYDAAIDHYKQSLEIYEQTLGGEHPHTASLLYDIGYAYYEDKKFVDALGFFEKSLRVYRIVLGSDHPATMRAANMVQHIKNEE